jgi:hypothetical protein
MSRARMLAVNYFVEILRVINVCWFQILFFKILQIFINSSVMPDTVSFLTQKFLSFFEGIPKVAFFNVIANRATSTLSQEIPPSYNY